MIQGSWIRQDVSAQLFGVDIGGADNFFRVSGGLRGAIGASVGMEGALQPRVVARG